MIRIVWALFLPVLIFAQADMKLIFKGNKELKSEFLYEGLNLDVQRSWYQFYKEKTPKIDKVILKPLKNSLVKLYKSQGFFKVRVDSDMKDKTIIFHIVENPPILIRDINISTDFNIDDFITFKKGDRFIVSKFISIREELKKQLKAKGYCNNSLKTKAYIDLKNYDVKLFYRLKKGKRCKFGKVTLHPPKNISKKVILSRLNYKAGDNYSSKNILKSYENLVGLDAFDIITIKHKNFGDIIDTNITLTAKENLIRREIGLGYDTKYGAKTFLRWMQRNFKGDARKLIFDLKYSRNDKYIKNIFFNPAFVHLPIFNKYFDFKNEFSYSQTTYERFKEKRYRNILHFQRIDDIYSFDGGIDFESIKIRKKGDYCFISDGDFVLLSPFLKVVYDKRDSKINPKNGIYISGKFQAGLRYLASSTSYTKVFLEGRLIKTVENFTIAGKVKVGYIKEYQEKLPESKLFFAGGAFSNRAYGYNRLGAFDSSCDDTGGKSIVDNSLEISHPLYDKLSMAVFWDATMISVREYYFNLDFIHSYGVGLRYKTPIGPVKIDYGVNAKDSSIYAIHFQIGQSF